MNNYSERGPRLSVRRFAPPRHFLKLSLTSVFVFCFIDGNPAQSQTIAEANAPELQEVVVTARRREENLQSVPVAVFVVNPEQLVEQGIHSAMDLQTVVPGLKFRSGDISADEATFALRGQTVNLATNGLAVIPYFSEVPLQTITTGQLYDIESIQVLKGPQGTLFGQVDNGGAILLNPVKPGNKFEGYAQSQFGNYNFVEEQAAVTLPIIDNHISLRVAGDITRREGYTKNNFNGLSLDNLSSSSGRIGLLITPFDSFQNYTTLSYNHSHTNGSSFVLTAINTNDAQIFPCCNAAAMRAALALQQAIGPRHVYSGIKGSPAFDAVGGNGNYFFRRQVWVFNTTTWDASDAFSLKNIFGYQELVESRGGQVGYQGLGLNISPFLPAISNKKYTDELQAQGKLFGGRLSYTAGTFFEWANPVGLNETIASLFNGVISLADSTYPTSRSKAGYAQMGYEIIDGLRLNAGIRHTHDSIVDKTLGYTVIGVDPVIVPHGQCLTSQTQVPAGVFLSAPCTPHVSSFGPTTYTLGLDYQINRDVFVYGSYRTGYRAGGVNNLAFGPLTAGLETYKPETDASREIGIKSTYHLGTAAFRSNIAVFYDTLTNSQQFTVVNPLAGLSAVVNAPSATIKGVEFDQTVHPFDSLTFDFSWAYLDAGWNVDKFHYTAAELAAACPATPLVTVPDSTKICPLNPFPYTAKNTFTAAVRYKLPVPGQNIVIAGDSYSTTKTFGDSAVVDLTAAPGYTIYNAHLTWTDMIAQGLSATMFVNNLTDKLYASTGGAPFLAAGSFGSEALHYAPPRLWGISVTYRF